jgi:hypothetical protein
VYVTKYLTKGWTNEYCKTIRKNLHLRIISFGGFACRHLRGDTPWDVVGRSLVCDEIIGAINRDLDWCYGVNSKLTFKKEEDAYLEYTYVIPDDGMSKDEADRFL